MDIIIKMLTTIDHDTLQINSVKINHQKIAFLDKIISPKIYFFKCLRLDMEDAYIQHQFKLINYLHIL